MNSENSNSAEALEYLKQFESYEVDFSTEHLLEELKGQQRINNKLTIYILIKSLIK